METGQATMSGLGPSLSALAAKSPGIVLCSRPDIGAVTPAPLFSFFALTYGAARIATGIDVSRLTR